MAQEGGFAVRSAIPMSALEDSASYIATRVFPTSSVVPFVFLARLFDRSVLIVASGPIDPL
jgi:hypothetical protein